jgi:pilus assembly protein CpaE
VLVFLPSKAGGGCSTVALNTAAALANRTEGKKPVLLIEGDRRSGVFSILLNLKDHAGLPEALKDVGDLTPLKWSHSIVTVANVDLLAANPMRRGPLPTWADYYQLLKFAADRYDHIVVDLPEVINTATAELVRSAQATFIICTPEVPSLALARLRLSELDACEIPREKVNMLVNRYESGGLTVAEIEAILGGPVFATLPNDYREVKRSIMESRWVHSSSGLGKSCAALAQKISELGQAVPTASRFSLLRKLSVLAGA